MSAGHLLSAPFLQLPASAWSTVSLSPLGPQYSASSHFHQHNNQTVLLPTSRLVIQLYKSINVALLFLWGKLHESFPSLPSNAFPPCLPPPCVEAESIWIFSARDEAPRWLSGGVWVSDFSPPIQQGATQPWGLVLDIPRSAQQRSNTSRAGAFQERSTDGFPGSSYRISRTFRTEQAPSLLWTPPAWLSRRERVTPCTAMHESYEWDSYGPCALHSDRIELPAWGRLEEAEVFFLAGWPFFPRVVLLALICELKA